MRSSKSASRFGVVFVLCLTAVVATTTRAQVLSVSRDFSGEIVRARAIDDAGSVVYAVSSTNQLGTNPGHVEQIFKWDPATGAGEQITFFEYPVLGVSVSDDGQWLVFRSAGDLTGDNADESVEVFIMHPDGSGLSQVTSDTTLTGDGATAAVIAGSGNRILFSSDADPLGTNPSRTPHHFVVDRDGTGLVQLPEATGPAAISDDGARIVYRRLMFPTADIQTGPADASSGPVTIATTSPYSSGLAFSGDGGTIVFDDANTLHRINWDGSGLATVVSGSNPSITDGGQTVVYRAANGDIRRIGTDGSGDTLLVADAPSSYLQSPIVSGNGSRVALVVYGDFPGIVNPDAGQELVAIDNTGAGFRQLTQMALPSSYPGDARILTSGSRLYFRTTSNPLGENADGSYEIFTMLPNGTGLAQVTHTTGNGVRTYTVSDSGLIAFDSYGVDAGDACGGIEIYKINTNGTGLTRLTNNCPTGSVTEQPYLRFDGQQVVFLGIVGQTCGLYRIAATGGTPALIVATPDCVVLDFRMGTIPLPWVVYDSTNNNDGLNPNHRYQVARITSAGGSYLRVTADPVYDSVYPDVCGDGNRIVWQSSGDFVGENAAHTAQVFLRDVAAGTTRQISHDTYAQYPRITRDGAWVYYHGSEGSIRVSVATGERQRVLGILKSAADTYAAYLDVDGTGAKTLIQGQNYGAHTLGDTLLIADQTIKPRLSIGKPAPTPVSWDPDPQSSHYDVIRGDLAGVSIVGSTVDLGAVVCLVDNATAADIEGHEDVAQPTPGQAFFYLYRGTLGSPPVTGSFGQGTGGKERVASAGSCGS